MDNFTPLAYTGNLNATTTITTQSFALAGGAKKLRCRNLDGTNYALVGFGPTAALAKTNAADGMAVAKGEVEVWNIPTSAKHVAYLGDTGTVVLNFTQGT